MNFVDKFRPFITLPMFENNLEIKPDSDGSILHITADRVFGGVERMLLAIAENKSIALFKHEFALCFDGLLNEKLARMNYPASLTGPVSFLNPISVGIARFKLKRLIENKKIDVVICHGQWVLGLFAATVRKIGVRLAYMMHSIPDGSGKSSRSAKRIKDIVPDITLANSMATLANAEIFHKELRAKLSYPVCLMGNISDKDYLRRKVRTKLSISETQKVIFSAGRFEECKGYPVLFEAMAKLRNRYDLIAIIAGQSRGKEEYRTQKHLLARCEKLGLSGVVRWLGHQDDMNGLYSAADVYCQPNLSPESFGMTFIEAQAMGCPVVTTRFGGALETVEEGGFNKLIGKSDPNVVAENIGEIFDRKQGLG